MGMIEQMAIRMLQNNPEVLEKNPLAQQLMTCLQSGDSAAGEQLANNIINTMQSNKNEAIQQAQAWWNGRRF